MGFSFGGSHSPGGRFQSEPEARLRSAYRRQTVRQGHRAQWSDSVHAPKPAEISREVGGGFALFGGYITGRHIELGPNERIEQAWRTGGWPPGVYSIAKFELVEQGAGSTIVFDHTGFPKAGALASGWNAHYWEPLQKFLG